MLQWRIIICGDRHAQGQRLQVPAHPQPKKSPCWIGKGPALDTQRYAQAWRPASASPKIIPRAPPQTVARTSYSLSMPARKWTDEEIIYRRIPTISMIEHSHGLQPHQKILNRAHLLLPILREAVHVYHVDDRAPGQIPYSWSWEEPWSLGTNDIKCHTTVLRLRIDLTNLKPPLLHGAFLARSKIVF